MHDLERLRAAVQRNCDIADARHAGDLPLCVYLMKMREYYRWERGIAFSAELAQGEVGEWLDEREQYWESVEGEDLTGLPLEARTHDAFDDEGVNRGLAPDDLVYSGGIGRFGQPQFFLAKRLGSEHHGEIMVHLAGEELARNFTAPPAMSRGQTIYVRRDALLRHLWEVVQGWRWGRVSKPAQRVLDHYRFDADPESALGRLTDAEIETVILHERGEIDAGLDLGPQWGQLLNAVMESQAELVCRAVRDHLADCSSTLPALLAGERGSSLDYYFASFGGMRRELFPAAVDAYRQWVQDRDPAPLGDLLERAREHWRMLAQELLACHRQQPETSISAICELVERRGRL